MPLTAKTKKVFPLFATVPKGLRQDLTGLWFDIDSLPLRTYFWLLGQGKSYKDIAKEYGISPNTTKSAIARLRDHLAFETTAGLRTAAIFAFHPEDTRERRDLLAHLATTTRRRAKAQDFDDSTFESDFFLSHYESMYAASSKRFNRGKED